MTNKHSARIAAIVILYQPKVDVVAALKRFGATADILVVVWNSMPTINMTDGFLDGRIRVIVNDDNRGLGCGLNQGLAVAFGEMDVDYALLFDQDSLPPPDMGRSLVNAFADAQGGGLRPAAVGAALSDVKGAAAHVGRQLPSGQNIVCVPSLATSGTLISKTAFYDVGAMHDALFIDAIDHEWCFRAASKRLRCYVIRDVRMLHDMGDGGFTFMGRYRPVHRSPLRHYYITRNTIWLVAQRKVPLGWRFSEIAKIIPRLVIYCIVSEDRSATFRAVKRAIVDGFRSRLGKVDLGPKTQ